MSNDDETAPIDDAALEQIRAEAVKQQQHSGDAPVDAAQVSGARRRPRKRANPPSQPSSADHAAPVSPPVLPFEPAIAEVTPDPVPTRPPATTEVAASEPAAWQPGSRLSTRVNPHPAPVRRTSSDRSLIVAAAILVVALLVAIGLFLVANAVVGDDGLTTDTQETEQSE